MGQPWDALKGLAKKLGGESPPKPTPPAPAIPLATPLWVKLMTILGAIVLAVAGFLVLGEGLDLWREGKPPQVSERPSEVTFTVPGEESPAASTTGNQGTSGSTGVGEPDGTAEPPVPTSAATPAKSAEQITAKWPTSSAARSETLTLALLATGAGLLLAGAFASRVTSIKLPGGTELLVAAAFGAGKEEGGKEGVEKASSTTAAVASQAQKENKSEVLENPEKLALGGKKLAEQMEAPAPQLRAFRAMESFEAEAPSPLDPTELEEQAKRVLNEIS
ncbi:MAG: hypothetical protein M3335_01065 [Actinomycetota bacterium]|nr:hypothetical protein [Actinomycetota bacterium]